MDHNSLINNNVATLDTFSNITNKEDNATNSDGVILTGIHGRTEYILT